MRRAARALMMLALSCCASAAWAQQPGERVALDAVLESSLERHPTLAAARASVAQARGELRSAQGVFNTSLEGMAEATPIGPAGPNGRLEAGIRQPLEWWGANFLVGWRLGLGEFPVYKGEYKTVQPQGELFAGVELPLLRDRELDKRRLALRKGELEVQLAEQDLRKAQLSVAVKAAQSYWKWVASKQKLEVEERLLRIALERDAAILARVQAGDLPAIDHTENQRAIAQRRARVAAARGEAREAALALSLYWRDAQGDPLVVPEGVTPAPLPQGLEEEPELDGSQRPELVSLGIKQRALELELRAAQIQLLPKLDLSAKASKGLVPYLDYLDEVAVGVKLQYFLGQDVARGAEEAAQAALLALTANARLQQDEINVALGAARVALEVGAQRVELVTAELEVARQVEAAERERLEQGDSTLLMVNLREQSTADAEKQLIEAQAAYQAARAVYRAAAGRLR